MKFDFSISVLFHLVHGGYSYILGVDIDGNALSTCTDNLSALSITNVDLVQQDIFSMLSTPALHQGKKFDTVIMNPPFGTKSNQGELHYVVVVSVSLPWSVFMKLI